MKNSAGPREILLRELEHLAKTGAIQDGDALAKSFHELNDEALRIPLQQWKPEIEQLEFASNGSPKAYFAVGGRFAIHWAEWAVAFSEETSAHITACREIGAGILRCINQWEQAGLRLSIGAALLSDGATYFHADVDSRSSGWGAFEDIMSRANGGDGLALARYIALRGKGLVRTPWAWHGLVSRVAGGDEKFVGALHRAIRGARARRAQERKTTLLLWPLFRKAGCRREEIRGWLEAGGVKFPHDYDLETISRRWRRIGLHLKKGK